MFSMTGFGIAEEITENYKVKIQIKSVNHKYLDLKIKGISEEFALENKVRELVSKRINRGHIDLHIDIVKNYEDGFLLNKELLQLYIDTILQAKESTFDTNPINIEWVLSQPRVIERDSTMGDMDELEGLVLDVLSQACDSLDEMRIGEAKILFEDLNNKIHELEKISESIRKKASLSNEELTQKMRERIKEIKEEFVLDEARFSTEVALMMDKISIDEEITRLTSHIEQFNVIMDYKDPIGRKLDFLLQEMNREANTMGSKSKETEVLHEIVEIKSIIENIREQVQNIE